MKYVYIAFALLAITASCELRSTNFDPDNQLVSEDELAQISVWDTYQTEHLSTGEYESLNYTEFVKSEFTYRQNSDGKWIIEGSIKNIASEAHYKDANLTVSYYDEKKQLIGTDAHTINESLAPGDQAGFYFKSNKFKEAQSLNIKINQLKSIR